MDALTCLNSWQLSKRAVSARWIDTASDKLSALATPPFFLADHPVSWCELIGLYSFWNCKRWIISSGESLYQWKSAGCGAELLPPGSFAFMNSWHTIVDFDFSHFSDPCSLRQPLLCHYSLWVHAYTAFMVIFKRKPKCIVLYVYLLCYRFYRVLYYIFRFCFYSIIRSCNYIIFKVSFSKLVQNLKYIQWCTRNIVPFLFPLQICSLQW